MSHAKTKDWNMGVGLMSGTSLDGVDLAICSFRKEDGKWHYKIDKAKTVAYSKNMLDLLNKMPNLSALDFVVADRKLGEYYGLLVSDFILESSFSVSFVASHGHTIFHKPEMNMTCQVGHGSAIAAKCGLPVVFDFRSGDVAYGGQGAPLVPIGDELLFEEYDALVNLGGFSNISFKSSGKRIAYDICPVNIVLNFFARKLESDFDKDGFFAKSGSCNFELLENLNNIAFYSQKAPKTLGREWVEDIFIPKIYNFEKDTKNIISTLTYHAAQKIAKAIEGKKKVLFTGGGAKNVFLIDLLKEKFGEKIIVPNNHLVDYKEAMIFAFMGWLRINNLKNTISSSTGAKKSISAGAIVMP